MRTWTAAYWAWVSVWILGLWVFYENQDPCLVWAYGLGSMVISIIDEIEGRRVKERENG